MKLLFIIASLIVSTVASAAETKLEVKLESSYFVDNKEVLVDIPALNKELNAIGLAGLPELVIISKNPKAYAAVIEKRIAAANEALGRDMRFNLIDDGYIYNLRLCYRGPIAGVPALIEAMLGNFLREDQGILAIAAGDQRVINDEAFHSRDGLKERFDGLLETHRKEISKWLKYKKTSTTVLVMSDYGPQGDGTELEATEIPLCK